MLKLLVRHSGESRVIFIYGPTGVGKTTLRLLIEKWLIETALPELETDPGRLPVASVEAVVQKSGLFNSKDHIKCLFTLNEPWIDQMRRGTDRSDEQVESISKVFGIDRDRTALNGTGLMATNLVRALQALTLRSDLRFLTLLFWAQVLSRRGLLRHQRAWCPTCYQQWRDNDQSIYEPLLWSITTAQVCPYHHHCLLSQCPHCHQQQLVISSHSQPGHCDKCGQWLGSHLQTIPTCLIESEQQRNWRFYVVNNLGQLIATAPRLNSPPNRHRISTAISAYINQVSCANITAVARFVGMQQVRLSLWCRGKAIPQIDKLLQLTHCWEISLLDFLTAEVLVADVNKDGALLLHAQLKQPRKPYQRLNLESKQVLNVFLQAALQEYPPPSLQDVALRLKRRPLVLQHHFPDLSQAIKLRHADYRKARKQQKNPTYPRSGAT